LDPLHKEFAKNSHGHLFVDMLIMLHSNFFIGNPGSTVTSNVLVSG
jgi:hypothetical protein